MNAFQSAAWEDEFEHEILLPFAPFPNVGGYGQDRRNFAVWRRVAPQGSSPPKAGIQEGVALSFSRPREQSARWQVPCTTPFSLSLTIGAPKLDPAVLEAVFLCRIRHQRSCIAVAA